MIAYDSGRGRLGRDDEQRLFAGKIDKRPPSKAKSPGLPTVVSAPDLAEVDLVFLALHGGSGEDGTVQALLEILRRHPYTGSGRLGSALGWDKDVAKRLFLAAGVPTPDWLMAPQPPDVVEQRIGTPLIVKPNGQGSTVGLTLVQNRKQLDAALKLAATYDADVMIERYIAGPRAHGRRARRSRAGGRRDHPEDRADLRLCRKIPGGRRGRDLPEPTLPWSRRRGRRISRCAPPPWR